jgi:hypothetical protein
MSGYPVSDRISDTICSSIFALFSLFKTRMWNSNCWRCRTVRPIMKCLAADLPSSREAKVAKG